MDNIRTLKVPVYTIVDGFCASAATFLSVVGEHRQMTKNSFMLIHQLSTSFWGKYEEFEDEKKNLDMMMQMIKNVYNEHTNVPSKELDKILKRDLMLNANKCLKWGLIDEII
jgi:ATP-dependent protease ClpP protease subunit